MKKFILIMAIGATNLLFANNSAQNQQEIKYEHSTKKAFGVCTIYIYQTINGVNTLVRVMSGWTNSEGQCEAKARSITAQLNSGADIKDVSF